MTTYNCPRCGGASTPEHCPACGRGPEPLLSSLDGLDQALRALSPQASSRRAVEAERLQVLAELGHRAAAYRSEEARPSPAPASMPAPTMPAGPTPHGEAAAGPTTPRASGEVASTTVQTVLLSLGGILVAAAIITFTAVAWRHLGDAGRLAVLGAFTTVMLAVPAVLLRFRLSATAETFASLAALALWCSALAGYHQFLPSTASLSAEAVGTWSMLVAALLALYRAAIPASATGWALVPLAGIGSAFAAAGDVLNASLLMGAMAVVLAGASWIVANRPSGHAVSDRWSARTLLCGGVVLALLAGLRAAFDLSPAALPPLAAAIALLAAGNLLATLVARRAGASATALLAASSATVAMVVAAWVLAVRSGAGALLVPSLALMAAGVAVLVDELSQSKGEASRISAALAFTASLATLGIVVADSPELVSYLAAAILIGLIALAMPDPMGRSMRLAAYLGGAAVGAFGAILALTALPMNWWGLEPPPLLTWEVPVVMALSALSVPLVPPTWRIELAAFSLTFAIVAAGALLHHGDPDRFDAAPLAAFAAAATIALIGTVASPSLAGRCAAWSLLAVWIPVAAAAAHTAEVLDTSAIEARLAVVAGAAVMLMVAAGAPRRTRPDRVVGAVLAHVLAGATIMSMAVTEWLGQLIANADERMHLPAALSLYALALTGVALMAPVRKRPYTVAALAAGTAAWWALLVARAATTVEYYSVPPALMLFGIGLWLLLRHPAMGSWATLTTAIAVGLGPSLLLAVGEDGSVVRRVGVGAAALVVLVAGLARRWQAPLVLGGSTLLVLTINELALVWHAIPTWIPPAVGGAILIGLGATFEKRRRDLSRLRAGLRSMR